MIKFVNVKIAIDGQVWTYLDEHHALDDDDRVLVEVGHTRTHGTVVDWSEHRSDLRSEHVRYVKPVIRQLTEAEFKTLHAAYRARLRANRLEGKAFAVLYTEHTPAEESAALVSGA